MIGIIDYGMGNLFSVSKALERLNVPYFISDKSEKLMNANGLILPGVGSFRDAMLRLNESGLSELIKRFAETNKPLLGICLGMQLLFEESEENGFTRGLGLLSGQVVRFSGKSNDGINYKVPHMGWNKLTYKRSSSILNKISESHVYFVHSYYVKTDDKDILIASSDYHIEVPAVVGNQNILGMQFHPEKSSKLGMQLFKNFVDLVEERMKLS
ncbi:imidazole glycerol phosphate synthase subunit HisH [Pseudoneobacillus rhizosphaerae]|uniref:Imidazole glycerol phosphate synthase subunit HisH n=1 Tax=Pseudoneobacillus rhizosphaerae TaxID=2880968 RepID=A0A9C7G9P6_9BACI|nr:imidazole glycerol phosphate synthase subunit HisH [Pseudoneobacillus rhizosphaerae]CAG9608215.1 Imidazole glycerol phosphate synthase subunit HisH [Pseudoneobacillus rhizosphaerae]